MKRYEVTIPVTIGVTAASEADAEDMAHELLDHLELYEYDASDSEIVDRGAARNIEEVE